MPLVLLPGMMCDARLFGPQIAAFSAGRAVHIASLTGTDSIEGLAKAVLADAPPRFALAGLSMGGIVAMEMMRQAPERVERLALMDTNPLAEAPDVAARRGPQMEAVAAGRLRDVMRDELKPNYLGDGPHRQAVLELCMEMAVALGPEVFRMQSLALMARRDALDVLRGVRVPTLVLCGGTDRLCPPERHSLMHGLIAGSVLEVVDGAGHLPVLEGPEETNAALRRWLDA